ncbi:MAG: methylhydantoinase [Thaumarchaeota archaeon]|nr:MAG: methylhydantoinase [Nitrososphaerota archaeon]TLX91238.1 MAG: methylhydantoinase [Nitrososphaerota archaeon]
MMNRVRIGVDVGGTFTKSVAIDMNNWKIIGKVTVPTSHFSEEGVSTGIIESLIRLIQKEDIKESNIELISHSTTQAVNALLEGDTTKVGIIGMGVSLEKNDIIKRTNIRNVKLAPNKYLKTCYRFLDTSKFLDKNEIDQLINELKEEGAKVLVVSEAYGVDDPSNELYVMEKSDLPATAGHELTGIYGLEIRTLTAAINASILLKALNTAKYVEMAVRQQKISAPLTIMKGDGGMTDMNTFKTKPILTVLSGPAASVAGALLHLRILNGIFIEVGGTSTNICIIKNGKPEIKYVTIMNHPTCIKSLDVRVVGIAGGSLVRWSGKKITDVGPRSAHISGLRYSCFAEAQELEGGQIITFMPKEGDPIDYIGIEVGGGKRFAITTTCAANALELLPDDDYAKGDQKSAKVALSILGQRLGMGMEDVANKILDISTKKILETVRVLIKEYKLKDEKFVLIGGGGGASVLVPLIAKKLNCEYKIAENSEVISSIGVCTASIREEREKIINNPNPNDISLFIQEVEKIAISKGALPESISTQSEYINEKSLLRVTVYGNMKLDLGSAQDTKEIDDEEAEVLACELFGINEGVHRIFDMKDYYIFACEIHKKKLFLKSKKQPVLVLDKYGHVRISIENADIYTGNPKEMKEKIQSVIKDHDLSKNELAPQIHIVDGKRIFDFSSLSSTAHVLKAVTEELDKTVNNQVTIIVNV